MLRHLSSILLLVWALTLPAHADFVPYNGSEVAPNIAIIRVGEKGVTVELEIFVGDIPVFNDLLPDAWMPDKTKARDSQAERWARFAESGMSVLRDDGTPLPLRIELVEPRVRVDRASPIAGQRDPYTGQIVPSPPEDPRVVYAELNYGFEDDRPSALTFRPPTENDAPAITLGMLVYDRGVPVTGFRYLSADARLNIDWDDPWFSRFDARNLNRRNQSGATTYLYLEPREVRHESLIRLRDLAPWIGRELGAGAVLSAEEQSEIEAEAAELLMSHNPVTIDGVLTEPEEARAELLEIDLRGYQLVDEELPVSVNAAFVGIILSFPVTKLPGNVEVTWDLFDDRIANVPATSTDPAGPFLSGASPDDPVFSWTNHLLKYQDPQVSPVPVANQTVSLPVVSMVFGVFGLVALVALIRARRRGIRMAALGVAAVAGGVTLGTLNIVTRIPNPLAPLPDEIEAQGVLAAMLDNVAAAAVEITPEARTAAIAPAVSLTSHDDVAAELERGLAIRIPGGGLARVTEVYDLKLEDLSPLAEGHGFGALATWKVNANAGHWGHSHRRSVEYRALMEIAAEDGVWKLKGLTVLEARTPNA